MDLHTSSYLKIRAFVGQLRPYFIQVQIQYKFHICVCAFLGFVHYLYYFWISFRTVGVAIGLNAVVYFWVSFTWIKLWIYFVLWSCHVLDVSESFSPFKERCLKACIDFLLIIQWCKFGCALSQIKFLCISQQGKFSALSFTNRNISRPYCYADTMVCTDHNFYFFCINHVMVLKSWFLRPFIELHSYLW